ncbi:hypothetical protein ORIO_06490 [Cereibacter azotoformans]|uniref:hypothetical protein n=1 Tax=Cereibacter azotoformans TaxID=43057 RepID=UPI001EEB7301|nr:hypothetical protein [Cereibacter azotoformans]ULB09572.1 hypothetical protein ORIO_06490 [Cereibacter azotoformans]
MFEYGLSVAEDPEIWQVVAAVLSVRLTPLERAAIAMATLATLEPKARELVFNIVQWGEKDAPTFDLADCLAQALSAAQGRTLCLVERKQLLAELWRSLPGSEKQAFLARVLPKTEGGRQHG